MFWFREFLQEEVDILQDPVYSVLGVTGLREVLQLGDDLADELVSVGARIERWIAEYAEVLVIEFVSVYEAVCRHDLYYCSHISKAAALIEALVFDDAVDLDSRISGSGADVDAVAAEPLGQCST